MRTDSLAQEHSAHSGVAAADSLALLLGDATAGNHEAREALVGKYRPLVRLVADRYARRMFNTRYDESDVVQLTLLSAFTSFEEFNGATIAEFTRWVEVILERTTHRLWQEHIAQKRDIRRELAMQGCPSELSFMWTIQRERGPVARAIAGEQAVLLAQSLALLPDNYRRAIELRFIDGFKLREIAEQMETSVGAVAGYLRRGLEEMDQTLPSGVRSIAGIHE